jgi:hypothetical protein
MNRSIALNHPESPEQALRDDGHANLGRRAGLHLRRRAVHVSAASRTLDCGWAQPRSRRHQGDQGAEKLVAVIELKKRDDSHEDATYRLATIKREVTLPRDSSQA